MKIYEIFLCDNTHHSIKTLKFNSPISKKDLDKYFLEYKNLYSIGCFNKKGLNIYTLYKDKDYNIHIYNEDNERVKSICFDGETIYPLGEKAYNKHINELQKNKLERMLK